MGRGGFRRPFKVGLWIRDKLATGQEWYAHQLYRLWVTESKSIPLQGEEKEEYYYKPGKRELRFTTKVKQAGRAKLRYRRWSQRKVCSYNKFRIYISTLRTRGLIVDTRQEPPEKAGLAPRVYFRLARGGQEEEWLRIQA